MPTEGYHPQAFLWALSIWLPEPFQHLRTLGVFVGRQKRRFAQMAKPSQLQNMASVTLRQMQNHRKATHLGWAPTHPTVEAAYLFHFNVQQNQQGRRIRRGGKRNGISISGSEESGIVTAMSWLDLPWVRQGMTSNIFPTFGSRPIRRKWKVYLFSTQIHRCNLQSVRIQVDSDLRRLDWLDSGKRLNQTQPAHISSHAKGCWLM